jgi:hypothetical protein
MLRYRRGSSPTSVIIQSDGRESASALARALLPRVQLAHLTPGASMVSGGLWCRERESKPKSKRAHVIAG